MALIESDNLSHLADLIFEKSGIKECFGIIKSEIENNLKAFNLSENDEEHFENYPSYRRTFHEQFNIFDDGELNVLLRPLISANQLRLLEKFTIDGALTIEIERTDKGHKWELDLSVPFALNKDDSERFWLNNFLYIKRHSSAAEIHAYVNDDVDESKIKDSLLLYRIQLS
jgi:hypothetical protein